MALLGLPFDIVAPSVPEDLDGGEDPEATVRRLAGEKAMAVAERFPGSVIAAADTVVALDDVILGKPADAADALRMLATLRGRWHRVWTGIAVRSPATGRVAVTSEWTDVLMRDYTPAEAAAYVATGDALDKAAAYAIQHAEFNPVAEIAGCYANVMGLPLCRLHGMLVDAGCRDAVPPVRTCPAFLGIRCGGPSSGSAMREAGSTTRHNHFVQRYMDAERAGPMRPEADEEV